ncbi:MAG: DUF2085 domain-containing protein [Candidatus Moranbacteria bacterium]|nr:DUF2085 domain-containing protein [Candidatus Moranbacteria bacterium]
MKNSKKNILIPNIKTSYFFNKVILAINELRNTLKENWFYFFSHHQKDQLNRCYAIDFGFKGFKLYVCARCLGIYPGLLFGSGLIWKGTIIENNFLLIILGPVMTWIQVLMERCLAVSNNQIRTISGFCLGLSFALAVDLLFDNLFEVKILLFGLVNAPGVLLLITRDLKKWRNGGALFNKS